MRVLSGRAVILWNQLSTLLGAQARNIPVDPCFFPSFRLSVRHLEQALDDAIGMGLLTVIIGSRKDAMAMHRAFRQSLAAMEAVERPQQTPIHEWTNLHFVMGMVRLLDVCVS